MNQITLSGYVNNIDNKQFLLSYIVKKDNKYHNVKIKAINISNFKIVNNERYTFKGFLSYHFYKNKIYPAVIVKEVIPLKKGDFILNSIENLKCKIIKLKKLEKGNSIGTLIYNIKTFEGKTKQCYYSFIALKNLDLPVNQWITINGFFSGDIKDNLKKSKIFINKWK